MDCIQVPEPTVLETKLASSSPAGSARFPGGGVASSGGGARSGSGGASSSGDGGPSVAAPPVVPVAVPPVAAAAAADPPVALVAAAPRERRGEHWPTDVDNTTWKVAAVFQKAVHTGWGAECGCHHSDDDVAEIKCKKMLMMGKTMSSDECKRRVQGWLLEGATIDTDDAGGRKNHVFGVNPRNLPLYSSEDLEAFARAHWASQP